jgi:hypothetical protein
MAGTIVADTIQNGAGTSTSMTNAITGSAKAWANFNSIGGTIVIRASYNVSSITFNSTGYFTVNLTTALADTNYALVGACSVDSGTNQYPTFEAFTNNTTGTIVTPTTSSFAISTGQLGIGGRNPYYVMFSVFSN